MNKVPWYQGRLWHGIDFFCWLRLLARNRFAISPSRMPAALSITLFSGFNTALRLIQDLCYRQRLQRVEVRPDPVLIVGHWRTGTTMLHELLALDPHHRCPTTYESLAPNHFLISERLVRRLFWFMLPKTRPMDNMRMSFDRPQEDEAALCNRGVPSPFATVAFPNRPPQYPRYIDLEELSPRELDRWEKAMRRFLKELLLKRHGRLVLKSPQHTFRLNTIARMFPRAEFIHIVRDPYVVFPSTVHFWKTMYRVHGLQRPTLRTLHDDVFEGLNLMYERFEKACESIDPAQLYQLRYEDLVDDPVGQVRAIYDHFCWPGFEAVEPATRQYAERSKRYQTNRYEVPPELHDEITRRWARYVEKYGYQKEANTPSSTLHA